MSQRNYNNVTTIGTLSAPLASSATSIATTGFTGFPATPFTVTLDRNTATEEICLVTSVVGSVLTLTRGYDGTAAIAHSAGGTIEHTAGAIEYREANTHVNATSSVHGVTGNVVGDQGAQSIFDKTLVSPVAQADVTAGDAVVAFDPTGTRNLFRGMDSSGTDVITVDHAGVIRAPSIVTTGTATVGGAATVTGALTASGGITVPVGQAVAANGGVTTTTVNASGNATIGGTETVTGLLTASGGITVPTGKVVTVTDAPATGTSAANKTYVDGKTWTTTAISDAASVATPSVTVKRDSAGRAQMVDPAVAADIATKNYVDGKVVNIPSKMVANNIAISTTAGATDCVLAVSFGTTFASAPVVLLTLNGSSSDFWWIGWARNITTTGFQAFIRYTNGTSPTTAVVTANYLAVGS